MCKLPIPLTVASPVLAALAEGEPVDMAIPDVDTSPELAIAHATLVDGAGGVIVSMTRVVGVVEPSMLAEISEGMMADGIEVTVLVMPASVQVAIPIPGIGSIWAIVAVLASARRDSREAMTAEELLTVRVNAVGLSVLADAAYLAFRCGDMRLFGPVSHCKARKKSQTAARTL